MEDLFVLYDNPILRSLLRLIPGGIGSAADVYIMDTIIKYRHERLRTFFDELGNGTIELTEDLINTEDFLHCYFNTIKAVLNSRRREKIIFFARLLKKATSNRLIQTPDEYEYYLSILDELSYTEIEVLQLLRDYEMKYPVESAYNLDRLRENKKFWNDFLSDISSKFNLKKEDAGGILIRIERTGCIHYSRNKANDLTGTFGYITAVFKKITELITE
jgi:hypothetical protein